MPLMRLEVDEV